MVSLAIVGVGMYASAGVAAASVGTAVAITMAAAVAASAAYAYIDQPYIMPMLFGSDDPKSENKVAGLTLPTNTPGSPRYRVFGAEAYVPGHFLWIINQKIAKTASGGGSGKGATATTSVSERFADIGTAVCDGPILQITSALSNKTVFYGERFGSSSVFADPRVRATEQYGGQFFGAIPNFYNSAAEPVPAVAGQPKSWHPHVTSSGGTSAASIYLEGLLGDSPKNTMLSFQVNPSAGLTEGLGHHFNAGDVIEVTSLGDSVTADQYQSSGAPGTIRKGIYTIWYVGRDVSSAQADIIHCLPLAGQVTNGIGTIRPYGVAEAIIIRTLDESVCGFTPDFNIPILFSSPVINTHVAGVDYLRGTQVRNPMDHTFLSQAQPGGVYVLLKVEVWGCGGGFYMADSANESGFGVEQGPKQNWTYMGQTRLQVGNTYELQGFCNPRGEHSLITIPGELTAINTQTNWGLVDDPKRSDAAPGSQGERYDARFKILKTDLIAMMNSVNISDSTTQATGSYRWEGSAHGWTKMFPGNGQCTPQLDGQYELALDPGTWFWSTVNPVQNATGQPGQVRGSVTDFSNFVAGTLDGTTTPPSGTITTTLGPGGLRTWPGPAQNGVASPTAVSTVYGPDRAGGADGNNRGGIGDVGFCILPPKAAIFRDPSGSRCVTSQQIDPQSAAIVTGTSSQSPLTTTGDGVGDIAYRGLACASFRNLSLYQFGNAIPSITYKVKEAENRSAGDVVTMLIEEAAPVGTVVPGFTSNISAYGYSAAGGTPIKHACQPLSVAFGFSMQERAGKLVMLQDSELPIVSVPSSKLNARSYGGAAGLGSGLALSYTDSATLPQRVVIKYTAVGTGEEDARAAGVRSPGSPTTGAKDTLEYNLQPLVLTAGFAKQRAQELLNKSRTETTTSHTTLPPSRMDVMPGTVISTTSNNELATKPELATNVSFSHSSLAGDAIPGSISIPVRISVVTGTYGGGDYLEVIHSATLVDDGAGVIVGMPSGVDLSTATCTYTSGGQWLDVALAAVGGSTITFVDFESIPIYYSFEKTRTFRATKATLSGYDFTVSAPLVTTTHQHTVPVHQSYELRSLAPVPAPIVGSSTLTPVEDQSVTGPWPSAVPSFGIALSGTNHGGATIYDSPDGVSDWKVLGEIFGNARIGYISSIVEGSDDTEVSSMSAWTIANNSDSYVDYTQTLFVEGMRLPADMIGTKDRKEVLNGANNFMIGEEVVGVTTITEHPYFDLTIMSGLMRGLRGSQHAAHGHLTAASVTYLPIGDGGGIAHFEDPQLKSGPGNTRYLKAVLPGGTLASTTMVEMESRAIRSLPSAPTVNERSLTIDSLVGSPTEHQIDIKWGAPPTGKVPIFQEQLLPPYDEIYEVYAYDPDDVTDSQTNEVSLDAAIIAEAKASWNIILGDGDREITYTGAEQVADGFTIGDKIAFQIYARSPIGRGPRAFPDYTESYVLMTQVG